MAGFAPNWLRLAANGTHLGLLRSVSVHFGSQNVLKTDLISSRFVYFCDNMTHFGPKSDIPVCMPHLGQCSFVTCSLCLFLYSLQSIIVLLCSREYVSITVVTPANQYHFPIVAFNKSASAPIGRPLSQIQVLISFLTIIDKHCMKLLIMSLLDVCVIVCYLHAALNQLTLI